MEFKTKISLISKLYKIIEKFPYKPNVTLDYVLDNTYPELLSKLQSFSREAKVAICATNGKKTTLNIFNQILKTSEKSFISNLSEDIALLPAYTSLILNYAKEFNNSPIIEDKDYFNFAFNEFELGAYFNSIKFDYLLLHNIFADQNDFCSLEEKKKKIQDAIILNSNVNLVINADEPMFYKIDDIKNDLAKKRNKIYYGFNEIEFYDNNDNLIQKQDIKKCPLCGCDLEYKKRFYSHIGEYYCECGFKRPNLDIAAKAKVFSDYVFLTVFYKGNKFVFKIDCSGVYNAYNALGAIALALSCNINRKTITEAFESFQNIKARDEIVEYKNKNIKLKVIKNPVSLTETIRDLYYAKNTKLVFCFEDNKSNTDSSWIFDSNFSALNGFKNKIYLTGNRLDDMALKLKYSGVNPSLIVMDCKVKRLIECCYWELEKDENMLILTTEPLLDKVYEILNK